jgi:dTMP kinase
MHMFITLEGTEGCGKTSQVAPLAEFLRQQSWDVLTTREPGGTPIGEQIREVLHSLENTEMHARTEILLFQAARAQHVEQVIRPHLARGGVVICDRYADSTLAYQGYGRQQPLEPLRALVEYATGGLKPDLTLLLDLDVEVGLRRRAKGGEWNRLDALEVAFYQRVRRGYYELVQAEAERWVVIDASQSPAQVQQAMRAAVMRRLEGMAAHE